MVILIYMPIQRVKINAFQVRLLPRAYSIVVVHGISGPETWVRFPICSLFILILFMDEQKGTGKNSSFRKTHDKMILPHNYRNLQEREKELLFTEIVEQNQDLKYKVS